MIHRLVSELTLGLCLPHLPTLSMHPSEFQKQRHTHTGSQHIIYPHPPNRVVQVFKKSPLEPPRTNPRVTSNPLSSSTQAQSMTPTVGSKLSELGVFPPTSEASTKPISTTNKVSSCITAYDGNEILDRAQLKCPDLSRDPI